MDIPTQYCELGNLQILNVVTSFFFILFALLAYKKTKNKGLVILLSFIGISSALWHSTSLPFTDLLDTLSITVFSLLSTYLIFSKVFKNKIHTFLSLAALIFVSFFLERLPFLNGSLVYIFLLLVLFMASRYYTKNRPPIRKYAVNALLTFAVAIVSRIADPIFCEYIPIGTHFLWHILMAFVGYNLILMLYKKD